MEKEKVISVLVESGGLNSNGRKDSTSSVSICFQYDILK